VPTVSGDEMTGTVSVPMRRYGNRTHTTKGGGMPAPKTRLRARHRPRRRGEFYRTPAAIARAVCPSGDFAASGGVQSGGRGNKFPPPRAPQPSRPLTRGKGRAARMT
jgi:hypothetical protein